VQELDPVSQYLEVELWKFESGRLGWSLKDKNGDKIDALAASDLVFELGEWLLAADGEIMASIFLHRDGAITTRRHPELDITIRKNFMWIKRQLQRSALRLNDEWAPGGLLRLFVYSMEWRWHKFRGHLKRSQNRATAAATCVAVGPLSTASEASECSENAGTPAPANVLPFRRTEKRDDIRPL
jgi:hypothetical protein